MGESPTIDFRHALRLLSVLALCLSLAPPARAYSYDSLASDGCHESTTTVVLRAARKDPVVGHLLTPIVPTSQEKALIEDLPFVVADDMRDLGGATLLVGVRDNDTKGHDGLDSMDLAEVHGDPATQREHCLRRPEHDEPTGTESAVQDCRDYIRSMVLHAVQNGLDADGRPDRTRMTIVPVHLSIAGRVNAELPIFWLYFGRALHAFQDSFSHNFRRDTDGGGSAITTTLNFVEIVSDGLDERRDGPPHMVGLDQCRDIDDFRAGRLAVARRASTELLVAALTPGEREAGIDAVLEKYLSYQPGCTFDNQWCDAPENRYRDPPGCNCDLAGADGSFAPLALLLAIAAARRRRRRLSAIVAATGVLTSPSSSFAQAGAGDRACVAGIQISCACPNGRSGAQRCAADGSGFGECEGCNRRRRVEPRVEKNLRRRSPFGLYAATGLAIDNGALAASLGPRHRLSNEWLVGVDAEYNPWLSLETKRLRPGAGNAYVTLIRRFPVNESTALRTTAHAGISVLLFDLYGARAGSFGPYAGLSLVGIELFLGGTWRLIVDPADVAWAMPKMTGVPLLYRQYRFTLGIQLGA